MTRAHQILAWGCIAIVVVLSLVPGSHRPHTFLPGLAEHFIAYAVTGFFFALNYRSLQESLLVWVGLAIASGIFEILQNFIPGRSPSPVDALASVSGLSVGLITALILAAVLS